MSGTRRPLIARILSWRWSIRGLMIGVAIVGLILGGITGFQRRQYYQTMALRHEVLALLLGRGCSQYRPDLDRVRYHQSMQQKYLWASERPWRVVEVDTTHPGEISP